MEKKELKIEELKDVNGGQSGEPNARNCPQCGCVCYAPQNIIREGASCDEGTFWCCPKCGYRWK